jgi:hypothetical protein
LWIEKELFGSNKGRLKGQIERKPKLWLNVIIRRRSTCSRKIQIVEALKFLD